MSDPTQPASADPAAPIVQPPAAPAVAAPPAAPLPPAAVAPRVLNPYAAALAPKPAAPAVAVEAPPAAAPAAPPVDPRIDALMAIVSEDVARDLAAVPENVRAAVRAFAGDDPIAQRNALATMRANGLAGAVTLPPGASTAVPSGQPAPAPVASPDAVALAEWELARSKGATIVAAAIRARHGAAIDRAIAARSPRTN